MQTDSSAASLTEVEDSSDSDAATAGAILQQERQRLGLNEKEVADQLHITMHYVKALESNNYEKLPGAVFAKGYIKSYALLLGLDEADLLSRYDNYAQQQQANIDEQSRLKARRKKDRNKPFVIASLLVFVGGFLGLWLVNSYFAEEEITTLAAAPEASSEADGATPVLSEQAEPQISTRPQLTVESEPVEAFDEPAQSIQTQLPAAIAVAEEPSSIETDSAMESADDVDAASEIQELTAVLEALRAEQLAAQTSEPATEADQSRVITIEAIGNDVLRISFIGESWVEVNDSASEQIYRDIREAGDVLEITGSAPFNILLGDAPYTRMSLNGAEIDLSSDIRIDNSARLTVGL